MKEARKRSRTWSPEESDRRYAEARILRADARNRRSLRAFVEWLSSARRLEASSIAVRVGSASTFVDYVANRSGCSCARAFSSITVETIEDFFIEYGECHGPAARRSMQAAMRLFLRFAQSRGWVGEEMVEAVPSPLS